MPLPALFVHVAEASPVHLGLFPCRCLKSHRGLRLAATAAGSHLIRHRAIAAFIPHATDLPQQHSPIVQPPGRSVTTLVNTTPIHSEDGGVESVVVTLQDMTPLEELERLRAEFLAMVSHELRAPLTSIKGSAATLIGSGSSLDTAETLQFHRIIEEQADHMHGLIADLLDVARIEAGALSVSPEPTEAAILVDRARSTFLSGGGRDNIQIDLPPDLPRVMADRRRIVQVLRNLLSNAATHSPEPSAIRVTAAHKGVHVAVTVADDGVGISAERLPYLFRKFSRREGDDGGRGLVGSGLGLAICKGIVEAHGVCPETAEEAFSEGRRSQAGGLRGGVCRAAGRVTTGEGQGLLR